ncbi:iron-sulfur cluster biosynthesis family protein [Secundilactobacillus folii]|uniref:Iron-sulfur cluster biosynthesis family protein n=1 Tax=Secundilactobacillus folii TaxID=2678357 RepID=A0A7X3C168_9LACO|nr:iron-sulfur cluster biosynthesis family protein [Secundilactobacillus folii]MTV81420.1 iron-sulfur cluster biosynthesis family protein [Secundilactobacillus folii]
MTKHLEISPEAIAKIKPHLNDHTRLLLSYDDGVGPYSHHGLVALQVSFQIVLINDDQPFDDYDEEIETNFQPMYIKSYSSRFLADQMNLKLQPKYQTLILSDNSEEIDQNVEIVDERK